MAPTCRYGLIPVLTRITPKSVYRSFSHDVTAAIFVYKTMNSGHVSVKKILWELNSFHFYSNQFAKLLTT